MTKDAVLLATDHTGRILVVDDDAKNRQLLNDLLTARGHTVIEAASGEEALRIVAEAPPDVVLLDVMMRGIDGFDVCRQLKADPQTAHIPVLLVTALAERADRIKGIEAGANDFITKPIDTRDVVLRARNAVHIKHLHDELQRSLDQLRELEELRDNLTHLIVHDMKTPLGGIGGYLELLEIQAKEKLTEEEIEFLDEARDGTRRLLTMAGALLDVGRLEEGKMPLECQDRSLRELAAEAAHEVGFGARQKRVNLSLPGVDAVAHCDPVIIRRVLVNLLENAIKFVPEEGAIGILIGRDETSVKVSISDNGLGIPPEYHAKIFEKFGQVELRKEKRLYSMGLGLAFCKLAVEAHGGTIGVISDTGQGTSIWFTLPSAGA